MARRRPVPGSLPLPKDDPGEPFHPAQLADPPWRGGDREVFERNLQHREQEQNFTELQQARKEVARWATAVRTDAFDDWVRRCVVEADTPAEWSPARDLYASYLAHATTFGRNRAQKGLAQDVLATLTAWGKMMTTLFPKTRRTHGVYYPLRAKRGA